MFNPDAIAAPSRRQEIAELLEELFPIAESVKIAAMHKVAIVEAAGAAVAAL